MDWRGTAGAVALLAAGLIAAGCGGDDESDTAPAPTQAPTGASTDASTAPRPPTGDGEGGVSLSKLGDFAEPVFLAQPPSGADELYVVEQGGVIRVLGADGSVREEPFLDISEEVTAGGEQGLLSVAFAPDYGDSGRFYVHYTDSAGDGRTVEYRRSESDPLIADPESARELMRFDDPYSNHNGGLLLFGPDDHLYFGIGDGGSGGDPDRTAQDLASRFGKLLRFDPEPGEGLPYSIPGDNPFLGEQGALPEIYSYGLRNPWRFSFDRETGALVIGDVGQSEQEEIDYVAAGKGAGANFGWSAFEGDARFNTDQSAPGHVPPVLTYGREGGCSVTGGYVVRDRNLESLYGRYLYGDFCAGQLRSFVPSADGARDDRELGLEVPSLSSFAEDASGRIYALSLEGPVYRLDPE